MKFPKFNTIAIIVIVLGVLGGAFWVSRVPYREDEPIAASATTSGATPAPTPPKPIFVVITSPTNGVVGAPLIQLKGNFVGSISSITYDVLNSEGCRTNQRNYVINWGPGPEEVATNYFECPNLPLSKGTNQIVLHTLFDDGRNLTNQVTYVLDFSNWTNPPEIKILWPSNETSIAGSMFTLQAQVADPTTTIHVSVSHQSTPPLEFDDAIVEHNGRVIVKDLPLEDGTNVISVVARDAAGNSSTTNLNIYGSPIKITMRPVNPDQLHQQYATVSGMISDASLTVWVNGQQATVSTNGQWTADNVTLAQTRTIHSFKPGFQQFGYRPNVTFYFTVSAFKEKAMVATQRFEASP
ncbi:MAG: hypothetical protein ABSC89_08840 [Verrucomicrobiota bacterium]|jgi:hypothetical protein